MDLIDREKLKEAIKMATTVPVDCSYDIGYNDMVLNAVKIADSMPTVDAQPVKHGRWIPFMPDCRGYTEEFECSLCKNMTYLHCCEKDCDYEYCPNCGSKMDGGDTDER